MDVCIKEWITRSFLPGLLVSRNMRKARSRLRSRIESIMGLLGTVELYFAFDDPYSAIALPLLRDMMDDREMDLKLFPVIERGVPGDPDADKRRCYSLMDARRLGARLGVRMLRTEPLAPGESDFLALWAEAAAVDGDAEDFSIKAMDQLYNHNGPPDKHALAEVYRRVSGSLPPDDLSRFEVRLVKNARRLRKKGHWEAPAALVYGQWYFAHERIEQIRERLDYLGR